MTYVDGFVAAVPRANRAKFLQHATAFAPLFREYGATRVVECWGDDVPDGKVTDFKGAVKARDDEVVVFSWVEYPDKKTRDDAGEKLRADPRMAAMGKEMPFDGQRMIFGGFASLLDEKGSGSGGYTDGFVVPVPEANREAYREMAAKAAKVFVEYGATRVVEAWGDDVKDGKVTDFRRAVKAEPQEKVVFSWVEWPSKAARNEAWEKAMKDERMQPDKDKMPFDGQRMFWGGFEPIVEG